MSVNNITNIGGFFICTGSGLKEETKRKLIALGIDPSTVTSEAEAQRIIENAEQLKKIQKIDNESLSKNKCTDEEQLKRTAENENSIYNMLNMTANVNKFILGL